VKYHTLVTGDIVKATETYEVWSKLYPRDWSPFNGLSARYQVLGQYEKALAAAKEAVRLEPNHYLPYANLANSAMSLNRFDEAAEACRQAEAVHRDSYYTHHTLFELALLRNDGNTMERELAWSRDAGRENDMLSTQGFALMAQGKVVEARKYFKRSWNESKGRGLLDNIAYSTAGVALAEADFGQYKEARSDAEAALRAGRGIDAEETVAEALALAGDEPKAGELTADLEKRYPLHVALINASLPAIAASAELGRGRPAEAVRLLEQSREWDLCEFSGLSPV
jgi:tetratricopeptide (TPR) repeat protein